jgi:hypothetical protein
MNHRSRRSLSIRDGKPALLGVFGVFPHGNKGATPECFDRTFSSLSRGSYRMYKIILDFHTHHQPWAIAMGTQQNL